MDKIDKIKFYLEDRLKRLESIRNERECTTAELGDITCCKQTLEFIDSLQEEPVSKKFAFKAIPRLLEMIEPTDRAKAYIAKLADTLEVEGYSTDAKIVRVSLKIMNGEKVPMATMDKETVSEDLDEAVEISRKEILLNVAEWIKDTFIFGKDAKKDFCQTFNIKLL